jgi:hypothetical protein
MPKIGILHGDKNPARNLLYTATRVMLNKIPCRDGKNRAMASVSTVTIFWLGDNSLPGWMSANTNSLYCRAVMVH